MDSIGIVDKQTIDFLIGDLMIPNLPYLSADVPGIGGQIKTVPGDFYVEEIPLYEPGGEGQHLYVTIEKKGIATLTAVNRIASVLKINPRKIGYAGQKDAQAVTRQTISIDGALPEQLRQLNAPGIKIIAAKQHRNKLKLGHLTGNKFVIRVRGVQREAQAQAEVILTRLSQQGVPNYFGEQRFGLRQNSHLLGQALVKGQLDEFFDQFLGHPHPAENPGAQQARAAFDAGNRSEALNLWPSMLRQERTALAKLVKTNDAAAALRAVDNRLKRLFVSAFQSELFNQLLTERLDSLSQLETGDVAYIHQKGASFVIEDAAAEQSRADAFEISPAGPLFGVKYLVARGEAGKRELAALQAAEVSLEDFDSRLL
ncbi:MAG: tRNA pseudouridine(13) synthase TruD [Anaerolineaceae bacterium 4572_5.2]|nr:MAG: tRNA pseudouridine(13) synthase TruD [Anaerolineaceae bacterium 4572_5.2]